MTYFIGNPTACRLYAKCSGWQETLAHFFVKVRRPSLALILSQRSLSEDILSSDIKDQSLDSSQGSSSHMNTSDNYQPLRSAPPIFDLSPNPDDAFSEKQIQKVIQSTINNERSDLEMTPTFISSPNSVNTLMDIFVNNKESTSDFNGYTSETIITPPQSVSTSREDLVSLLKTDNSNDNHTGMTRNDSSVSSPLPRTTTSPSTIQLYNSTEINEEHKRLSLALREFLS